MAKPNDYPYGFAFQHAVSAAIGSVGDKAKLPRTQSELLRTVLLYIDTRTGITTVSTRRLAHECRMGDEVRRHLSRLIAKQVVEVVTPWASGQKRQLRINLSALQKLASVSAHKRSGMFQDEEQHDECPEPIGAVEAVERPEPVGAVPQTERPDPVVAVRHAIPKSERPDSWGGERPDSQGSSAPTQSGPNVERRNEVRTSISGQRENFSTRSFLSPAAAGSPRQRSGGGSAALKGTGAAVEVPPTVTTSESPSTTTAYSSPPVEAQPADLPPASAPNHALLARNLRYWVETGGPEWPPALRENFIVMQVVATHVPADDVRAAMARAGGDA